MADKITSVDKTKCKEDQRQKILILSEKKTANYWWLKTVLITVQK